MDDSPDMPPPYGFYPPGKKLIFMTFKTKKNFFVTPQLEHMSSWIIHALLRANIGVIGNQNHNYKLLNKSNLL